MTIYEEGDDVTRPCDYGPMLDPRVQADFEAWRRGERPDFLLTLPNWYCVATGPTIPGGIMLARTRPMPGTPPPPPLEL